MTRQEFNRFSESIRGRLLSLAGRFKNRTGMAEPAEDIVQEALLTVWKLSEEGYPIRDAEGLAVKITKNLAVARFRKQKLKIQSLSAGWERAGSGSNGRSGDLEIDGGECATDRTDAQDRKMIRAQLYGSLTTTQRKYLELRNDLGLSLDEIAETTGKPKSSIKTSISTARRQLLELYKKQI